VKYPRIKSQQQWRNRRWRSDRQTLLEFNRSLTLIADPETLMASISARITELFGADRIIILRALSDGALFAVAFNIGYNADGLKDINLTHRDRLAKWLFKNETALVIDKDAGVLQYLSDDERKMLTRLDVKVCVPLIALNRLTGLILLSSTGGRLDLNEKDLSLLQILMSQASIAFETAYLYQGQRDRLRQLYRAERLAAAGQLAASVAHEIRNPLTSIRSTIQYLLGEFDETHAKYALVEGIISEVDRIDRTVDGLLSLTRRKEFKPERIVLAELLEQTLLLLRTQAHNQRVEITWREPGLPVCIMGDASQVKQLLLNLLLNAVQAMPGGGLLSVELGQKPEPLGSGGEKIWALVSIADAGCGIPAENLDKIFDPFFTTKQGGTGLGLSTSYAIVRQHGGELEINSRENEGTTVAIRFPLVR
jgi:signal transduction histidine kinase